MNRTAVDSSQIKSIGYDEGTQTLEVEFRYSESVYTYFDVPKSVYDEMMASESVGKFFNAKVKGGGYKYEQQKQENASRQDRSEATYPARDCSAGNGGDE